MNTEKKTKIIRKRYIKKTKKYSQLGGDEPFTENDFKELFRYFIDNNHKLSGSDETKNKKIVDLASSMKDDPIVFTEVMSKYYTKIVKKGNSDEQVFSMVLLKNKKIDKLIDIKYINDIKNLLKNIKVEEIEWSKSINDQQLRTKILSEVSYLFNKKEKSEVDYVLKKYLLPELYSQLIYFTKETNKRNKKENKNQNEQKKQLLKILFNSFGLAFFLVNLGLLTGDKYFSSQRGGNIEFIKFTGADLDNKSELEKNITKHIDSALTNKGLSLRDLYNKVNNVNRSLTKGCTSSDDNIHDSVINRYNKELLEEIFLYKK